MPKPKHSPPAEEVALARVNRLLAEYTKQLRGWTDALDAAVCDYLAARASAAEPPTQAGRGSKSR